MNVGNSGNLVVGMYVTGPGIPAGTTVTALDMQWELLDLARKPRFLHDDSVPGLDALLDPKRGANSPHPFYVAEAGPRADVVAFLKGLEIPIPAPPKGK